MNLQYRVSIDDGITLVCFADDQHLSLKKNDFCIVSCDRYEDYGRVIAVGPSPEDAKVDDMAKLVRQATLVDQGKANENRIRSKGMHRTAEQLIATHKLPMSLQRTHLSYDRSLVIFVYTAPNRVDFRALLKDLNRSLQVRVELRQIGPRDQAAMVGGLGSCGRELCCSSFLTNFVSINIKMAKTQGVSLNPSNIIGACGRLKCCLEYEYEGYRLLLSELPRIGSRCTCEGCDGKVLDVNLLTKNVRVLLDDDRVVNVPADQVTPHRQ